MTNQLTCLPNGLCNVPCLFKNILKAIYATLREKGHLNVGYIEDLCLQGGMICECQSNGTDTCCVFTR